MSPLSEKIDILIENALNGDLLSLSRLLTQIEKGGEAFRAAMPKLFKATTSGSRKIGISGPPGAGKSTLIAGMIDLYLKAGKKIAVLCNDPTSPLTGGAILGDRIRMMGGRTDEGRVFIRSLGSGDSLGGLSPASRPMATALEACGFDVILIETVGVGQLGYDVRRVADTLALVVVPESGDAVQAIKSGLLELADIVVVNKADRQGANDVVQALRQNFDEFDQRESGWRIPVIPTVAAKAEGVDKVIAMVDAHGDFLRENGRDGGDDRLKDLAEILVDRVRVNLNPNMLKYHPALKRIAEETMAGKLDPYSAAELIVQRLFSGLSGA